MNELQLSNDLTTIETEIKSYQNIAGQSIFEIGRRLKHVKENDLALGEFSNWCKKLGFQREYANKHIKVFEEFNGSTSTQTLGINALYEIATLPEPERTKEHTTSSGETKTPDEMTVRELRELKKQLKQRDEQNAQLQSQVEQAQRSEEIAKKQLEDAESREPEVIEKYMEPEDYQETKNALAQSRHQQKLIEQRNEKLEKDIKEMELRRDEVSEKSQKYDELNKAINDMNAKLNDGQQRLKAQKEIYDLVKGSEKVIREVAPLCYLAFSKDIIDNDYARKPIEKIIEDLTDMANRLRKQLKKGDVIDV
ncbi:DNA repair exonuclease SbcCD ATPase subunit [Staphylococcus haemolyticus]